MIGWVFMNWRLILLAAAAFGFAALGIRVQWLAAALDRAERRADEAEAYKRGRVKYDQIDHVLADDPAAAREFLRKRKP